MSSCFTCLWTSITCYVNISKIQQKLQVNLRNWLRVPGVPRVPPYVWSLHQLTLSHSKYQMVPDGSLRQRHGWRNAFIWILARHEAYVLLLAEDILPMQLEKLTLKQILVTCRTFQTNLMFLSRWYFMTMLDNWHGHYGLLKVGLGGSAGVGK